MFVFKYTKIYSGGEPELIEGDIFKTIIPMKNDTKTINNLRTDTTQDSTQDSTQVSTQVGAQDDRLSMLLDFCAVPRSRDEMQQMFGISTREYFRKKVLKTLLESGQLKMTIPDKPNSRNQKYVRG